MKANYIMIFRAGLVAQDSFVVWVPVSNFINKYEYSGIKWAFPQLVSSVCDERSFSIRVHPDSPLDTACTWSRWIVISLDI
jgi:hypothetical protein